MVNFARGKMAVNSFATIPIRLWLRYFFNKYFVGNFSHKHFEVIRMPNAHLCCLGIFCREWLWRTMNDTGIARIIRWDRGWLGESSQAPAHNLLTGGNGKNCNETESRVITHKQTLNDSKSHIFSNTWLLLPCYVHFVYQFYRNGFKECCKSKEVSWRLKLLPHRLVITYISPVYPREMSDFEPLFSAILLSVHHDPIAFVFTVTRTEQGATNQR